MPHGVTTRDGADQSELTWHSDKDGLTGVGSRVRVDALSAGTHVIELRDGERTGQASRVTVLVGPPGALP